MRTVDDLVATGVAGRRVLVRADLNVPLDAGHISDDGRIRASLPTLELLAGAGARVLVCAHLGRPKGEVRPELSLRPVAARLGELLGHAVAFAGDVVGPSASATVDAVRDGRVALLENVRFEPGETSKDPAELGAFADRLAGLAERYVDDAFGVVHRAHASVVGVAERLPSYAGRLVMAEAAVLRRLTEAPARPYVVVLGGSKVADKLAVIESLVGVADRILVGGGMCFTFLVAQGHAVGSSLVQPDQVDAVRRLLDLAAAKGVEIALPTDVVAADAVSADAPHRVVPAGAIPAGQVGVDIGPETVRVFSGLVADAGTVFWNGPMGVFEKPPLDAGTLAVARAVAACAGTTVAGGGDSIAALRAAGLEDKLSHISTGGGASLEYLAGERLPGVEALSEA